VDAWIDVINANINGGVRTAFKASRLKFSGSNIDVTRAGTSTSLPLQFPEPGLTTANTVIDFSQGAITASTENTHLAIQGEGFFRLANPLVCGPDGSMDLTLVATGSIAFLFTRDGEFHTDANGFLVHSSGWFLISGARLTYNDLELPPSPAVTQGARLSDFLKVVIPAGSLAGDGVTAIGLSPCLVGFRNEQRLEYSMLGSTIFDGGFRVGGGGWNQTEAGSYVINASTLATSPVSILTKSLEASNASMTQSVPELSLAQKLFSALTKVLQTKQTNVDGVLNLVR
jgi:flagellar hook protein FlgE